MGYRERRSKGTDQKHILFPNHITSSSKPKKTLTRTHHNRESYCTVLIRGEFTTSLPNTTPHVSFNVTSHLPYGRTGLISGEDAFCNWVDVVQDGGDDDNAYIQTPAQASAQQIAQIPIMSFALSHSILSYVGRSAKTNSLARPRKERRRLALRSCCWGPMFQKQILRSR